MNTPTKNEIWSRNPFDSPHFPENGWKVRIVDFDEESEVVTHEVWEYNGRLTSPSERTAVPQELERFLRLYHR